jgi:hypothetical protein
MTAIYCNEQERKEETDCLQNMRLMRETLFEADLTKLELVIIVYRHNE